MSLHRMLQARAAEANPLRIGVIGAGKFGSMYLSQIPTTPNCWAISSWVMRAPDFGSPEQIASRTES